MLNVSDEVDENVQMRRLGRDEYGGAFDHRRTKVWSAGLRAPGNDAHELSVLLQQKGDALDVLRRDFAGVAGGINRVDRRGFVEEMKLLKYFLQFLAPHSCAGCACGDCT